MTTIKSYTDFSQSKKLAEILPLESADMHSEAKAINGDMVFIVVSGLGDKTKSNYGSPVWSLTALLNVLPSPKVYYSTDKANRWYCECWDSDGSYYFTKASNSVDACYKMVINLKELNLL